MTQRIDLEVLADLIEPRDPVLSPDGQRVVYNARPSCARKSEHLQSALWIADVGKRFSAKQLTHSESNHQSAKFSPDGKYISFLSDRAHPGKGMGLYILPIDGGEAIPLTSKEYDMDVGNYEWKPDSTAIAFIKPDEKTKERKEREEASGDTKVYGEDVDYQKLHVIVVDDKSVTALKCVKDSVIDITWKEDGTQLVYTSSENPELDEAMKGVKICIADIESDTSTDVCSFPSSVLSLCWDQDTIMWCGGYVPEQYPTDKAVYAFSLEGQGQRFRAIAHGKTDGADDMKHRNGKIVVRVLEGLNDVLELLDGTELFREKSWVLSWDVHFQKSTTTLAVVQGRTGTPPEVFSIVDGQKIQLSQHGTHIADMNIGKCHLLEYTHEDGTPIDGYYAVPSALEDSFNKNEPQPTVLIVHGGPQFRITDCFNTSWHWDTLLMSSGYLVLCPNYRGGTSHGHEYAAAVHHDSSTSYQDVIWLVEKGIKEGKIDRDRVAITGWSQGGYLSYLAVTRDETFHFRAAVPGAGVTDWTTMNLTSDLPLYESQISGPKPWEMDSMNDLTSRKCSPLYFMQNITTPILILHGEADRRIGVEQAIGFYRGLKEKGKDVTMVTYPREPHYQPSWERKHYIDMLQRLEVFLKKHM